jgi:hypothetical protein
MAFDFSTLPKARAYTQLGKLGACTWYTPWDCYTPDNVQQAKAELEDAHVGVIDFATAAKALYDDAVANQADGSIIAMLGQDVQNSRDLLTEHTQLMNTFYQQTGTGVAGLKGLRGLGNPLVLAEMLGLALRWVGFGILLYQLGDVLKAAAQAFQEHFKQAQADLKMHGEYYIADRKAIDAGLPRPQPPAEAPIIDTTTLIMMGGIAVMLFMFMGKRR